MKIGITFPTLDIGTDRGAIKEYVQTAEGLGFDHITVYDHVLGADTMAHADKLAQWPYNYTCMFHEPMVLMGFIAAATEFIELNTAVIILGQRQTTLAAKQAAEVDVLCGGRLRLGVGTGWNPVEYQALNEDFNNRGTRIEEQVEVMRLLWTQDIVTYAGQWHQITAAGLNPPPVQRPIPIWMGGFAERVLERIGRIADGWYPIGSPRERAAEAVGRLRNYAKSVGRDPKSIGVEARVGMNHGAQIGGRLFADVRSAEDCVGDAHAWEKIGATHITLNTMDAGLSSVSEHIDAMRRFKEAMR